MDHTWREVVIIVIVVAGPFISLFPKQVESWGGMRWVALILLGALFSGWEIIKDRSAEAFLARAEENLGQAEKKMEPDDPRRDDVRRLRRDIESLAEYGARRSERYNRIFEEQRRDFPQCFQALDVAREWRTSGQLSGAVTQLSDVVSKCPGFYLAEFNLGLAYEALGKLGDAGPHYAAASLLEERLQTRDPPVHNTYAFLLLRLRRFDEAEKEYLKALQVDPEHPKAKVGLEAARERRVF